MFGKPRIMINWVLRKTKCYFPLTAEILQQDGSPPGGPGVGN